MKRFGRGAAISSYKRTHAVLLARAELIRGSYWGRGPSSTLQTETEKKAYLQLSSVVAMHMGDVLPIKGPTIIGELRDVQTKNKHWVKWNAIREDCRPEADQARIYFGRAGKGRNWDNLTNFI